MCHICSWLCSSRINFWFGWSQVETRETVLEEQLETQVRHFLMTRMYLEGGRCFLRILIASVKLVCQKRDVTICVKEFWGWLGQTNICQETTRELRASTKEIEKLSDTCADLREQQVIKPSEAYAFGGLIVLVSSASLLPTVDSEVKTIFEI